MNRRIQAVGYNTPMLPRTAAWPRLERVRALVRITSLLAGTLLVAFHGWLFAGQMATGRLEDPWLVFRWIAAAALVAALVGVKCAGASVWGRTGIAIWVLAALLHGPAVGAASGDAFDSLALPEAVIASVLPIGVSAAIGIGFWLLTALLARRRHQVRPLFSPALAFSAAGILADGFSPPYASRPPPQKS